MSDKRVGQNSRVCSQRGATAQGNLPTTMVSIERATHVGSSRHEFSSPVDWNFRVRDPVDFHEGSEDAGTAVRHGWVVLREVMRAWGIEDADGLSNWLGSQGFPRFWKPHLSQSSGVHFAPRSGGCCIPQRDVRPVAPRSRVAPVGEIPAQVGSSWTKSILMTCANDEILSKISPRKKVLFRFGLSRETWCQECRRGDQSVEVVRPLSSFVFPWDQTQWQDWPG